MRLSVIIVSYNVYPFLDNCLRSVISALRNIDGEIIVVDNASVDRTPQLIKEHFPSVKLISNTDNPGFAIANNQAIQISKGEYILLLNPDTVVSEDTFDTCIQFMDNHPRAGAVGVRMVDGSGRFLPESKRGLPTLQASFLKMTGIYKMFPKSATLNRYYQGNIAEYETAKIEVLTGAFMFLRKSTLDKTGLLDDDFFMYGEDIDLSYRITRSGADIYYLPSTSIIHYKGESTKKSTLNYILTFYQAMLIFTRKHSEFSGQQLLIKLAIYVHGLIRFIIQTARKWWPPFLDFILYSISFLVASRAWAVYYFHQPDKFENSFYFFNIPLYSLIGTVALFLNGAYDKPYSRKSSWIGFGWGLIGILVIYAILPVQLRTSRMVILLGSFLYMIFLIFTRWKVAPWKDSDNNFQKEARRAIIVANEEETKRIKELINRSTDHIEIIGSVSPDENKITESYPYIGSLSQLRDVVRVHQIKEIIFSAQDVPFSKFTSSMTSLGPSLKYMLAASTTMNIVGSMNRDSEGESYAIRVHFKLSEPASVRTKRLFDIIISIILFILSPVLIFFINPGKKIWGNIMDVLSGRKTWVSYHTGVPMISSLPSLRPGVLSPVYPHNKEIQSKRLEHIHYVYARDYHWTTDLAILLAQWRRLGQRNSDHA